MRIWQPSRPEEVTRGGRVVVTRPDSSGATRVLPRMRQYAAAQVHLGSTLSVAKSTILGARLSIQDSVVVSKAMSIGDQTALGHELSVYGHTKFGSTVSVQDDTCLGKSQHNA